jgi:hypothetical protein
MKKGLILAAGVATVVSAFAADIMWIKRTDKITLGLPVELTDNITVSPNGEGVLINTTNGEATLISYDDLEGMVPGDKTAVVEIVFNGDEAVVTNPFAFEGVTVTRSGADVLVNSTSSDEITYHLTGSTTTGGLKIYSDKKYILQLDNVNITNDNGAAINSQSKKKCTVELIGDSYLTDSKKYATPDDEDEKGTMFSEGQFIFTGSGTVSVTAKKKHAICSDDYVSIEGGTVKVLSAASDGIHTNDYFEMKGGSYISTSTSGDGVDADTGYILVKGGTMDITLATEDTKGLKCDDYLTISGGEVNLTVSGDQCKGIKTKATMTMTGGKINANLSGKVVLVDSDPSYCAAIKTQDFSMTDGEIVINHTGEAGKGISVDGNCTFNGGNVTITASGNGAAYTDANGDNDSYSSTCITIDGDLNLVDGTFVLNNSGSAGKCIKVDGAAVFGDADHSPSIEAHTTGAKILESSSTGGNWGGWGPGGGGNSADYANPKVIKVTGNLTVDNGNFVLSASQDGGEGLESKDTLTINGGELDIQTYDDAINAAKAIVINGGRTYCKASGNDAIDSNGTITINGGLVVAIGAKSPECGFDCDNYTFKITGGTIFGIGGDTSSPTTSVCTQPSVKYSASLSQNSTITLTDNDGNHILSFKNPVSYSGRATMLFTSPKIVKGSSYKLYTGGTVSDGDQFHELTVDGSYTAGSQATSFTVSSMLTTAGSSSGGGGGGWW